MPRARMRMLFFSMACASSFCSGNGGGGSCLPPEMRLKRSMLQTALFELRQSAIQTIRVAQASWDSHQLLTEIYRILLAEYLGYQVALVPITTTVGAYKALSAGDHDVNVELWASVAPIERECFMVRDATKGGDYGAFDGGSLSFASSARSGLYLRPSKADLDVLLRSGRFYSHAAGAVLYLLAGS